LFYEYFRRKKKIRIHGRKKGNAFKAVTPPSGNISSGLHKRQGKIVTVTSRQVINVI